MCKNYGRKRKKYQKKKMKKTDKKKNGKTYGVLLIHWKFVKSKNRHVSVQTMIGWKLSSFIEQ